MVTDRIGDFIIRLQNPAMVGKRDVSVPYSAHLAAIAKKLKELGFIESIETKARGDSEIKKDLLVSLAYDERKTAKLRGVKRVSKPGRRMYKSVHEISRVRYGHGNLILSTPKGIKTDTEARKEKVGGEALFEIW